MAFTAFNILTYWVWTGSAGNRPGRTGALPARGCGEFYNATRLRHLGKRRHHCYFEQVGLENFCSSVYDRSFSLIPWNTEIIPLCCLINFYRWFRGASLEKWQWNPWIILNSFEKLIHKRFSIRFFGLICSYAVTQSHFYGDMLIS